MLQQLVYLAFQDLKYRGINMATIEEKLAYFEAQGISKDTLVYKNNQGEERSFTQEEWDEYVERFDMLDIYNNLPSEEHAAALNARIEGYPKTDPQLDAIFHGFKTLRDGGIDIGTEASNWVDEVQAVKDANPFPSEELK